MSEYLNLEYRDGTEEGCFWTDDDVRLTHDWRLISEESLRERDDASDDDGRPNFRRRWYCTRCRLVEEWTSL